MILVIQFFWPPEEKGYFRPAHLMWHIGMSILQTCCVPCVHTGVFCVFYRYIRENKKMYSIEKKDYFWPFLTNFDKFWQFLTNFVKIFDNFWQILTIFDKFLTNFDKKPGSKTVKSPSSPENTPSVHTVYTRCAHGVHTRITREDRNVFHAV
jgi:hypothetical protein